MKIRLAHFSDIHITAAPRAIGWRELLSKRIVGWLNLTLRGRHARLAEAERVTRALVADLLSQNVDHVLFTGDATGLALPGEFRRARERLEPLLATGRFTGLPGNHDEYVASALCERAYGRWLGDGGRHDLATPVPPRVRWLGDGVALICLSDARPVPFWDSSGKLGHEQLERLAGVLGHPEVARRRRVLALHYGPLRADGRPDTRFHGLRDGAALLEIASGAGVDLVLHGHLHHRFVLPPTSRRPFPIANPGSATFRGGERAYHIYEIGPARLRLEARRYDHETNSFQTWPDAPGSGELD